MKTINKILTVLAILSVFALAYAVYPVEKKVEQTQVTEQSSDFGGVNVGYDGYVTVKKYEASTNEWKVVENSKHNLLTNIGMNFIKAKLNGSDVTAANNLSSVSLSNDAGAPAAADAILTSEITTNGLHRNGTASWSVNGTGGFNYTATWTATAGQSAQKTGLQWSSLPNSGGNLFAELTFSGQSLLVNDQLQVVWQILIS